MTSSAFEHALAQGLAAHQARRLADAEAAYRAALAIAPDDAEAQSLLGLTLVHGGRPELAMDYLQSAVAREPHQAGFRLNLAEGLAATRDPAGALAQLLEILEFEPGHRHACARAAPLLAARADWPALQAVTVAWTRTEPANPEAWRQLARAAFEQGYHRQALEAYSQVLPLGNRRAEDLAAYAGLCLHALELERAAAALAEAESAGADLPEVHARLGLLHLYYGRFAEAEAACCRCLALDPGHVAAYTTLSRVRRGRLTDAELATVRGIAQAADRPFDHRIPAAFAAAHARDAAGQFDAAFAAYTAAHELALERDRGEGRAWDPAGDLRHAGWLMESAVPEPAGLTKAAAAPRPVFIVGMPRSGTTLVESLLGAHPRVRAGGERPAMRQILRAFLAMLAAGQAPDDGLLQEWAAAYWRDLPDLRGAQVVTDKHPLNFEAAGLIARLFPGALILNVRRNPLATGLSIYRQEFNKHWTFAHRLADIGRYYGHYARLADHWQRALPGRFLTVQYEDLAGQFDAAAPRLLQACGLEWQPQCLAFQRSPNAIATFSAVEAREAVTVRNGRAAAYAAHLAPLIEALQAEGVDLETGKLLPGPIGGRPRLGHD